jgi:hypothetical protein
MLHTTNETLQTIQRVETPTTEMDFDLQLTIGEI